MDDEGDMATAERNAGTIEVPPVDESRSTHPPVSARLRAGILSALATAPERLLLVFLSFCYVIAVAYVSGFFRPAIVFPVAAVAALLTWRLCSVDGSRDARTAIGSALSLVLAFAWFLANLPYISERVQVTRDPDLYTLAALW